MVAGVVVGKVLEWGSMNTVARGGGRRLDIRNNHSSGRLLNFGSVAVDGWAPPHRLG